MTAPIDKAVAQSEGLRHPGHTEYLAERAGTEDFAMLMAGSQINAERYRERRKAPVELESAALRWGQQRERHLLKHGPTPKTSTRTKAGAAPRSETKEVPTFAEFAPRFLEGHVYANRHKPTTVKNTKKKLRLHILPAFGGTRLHELAPEDIQLFKGQRKHLANSTINKLLGQVKTMLEVAVRWRIIEAMPLEIEMLELPMTAMEFYDFDEFETLVTAATRLDQRMLVMVLLGGEAGLRSGEIRGLEWSSINFRRRLLTVEQAEWEGHVTLPKHDKIRTLPMTERLTKALRKHRHSQGPRVLYEDDGEPLHINSLANWLMKLCRRAKLEYKSPHKLRHTFCSHLAMRGAPARAIQELAGHGNLQTTQRYMHLSPAALERAIKLLELPSPGSPVGSGDMVETV
ncbi:tyrosine-type recombinase/integrase [Pseudenhygromyxa sp. WMMC2535]|uniref:tyrosine-type recombinase/integrase n=1 Tax=Pseudenhygromyxa sp. WMMC2535 TaxID=2712867 RepID=UPI0015545E3B|nr:tyrosine-type recombinase/integrase [Pseudenhygromyxa sp. WMMC2535]